MRRVLASGDFIVSPDAWDFAGYVASRPTVKRREGNPGVKDRLRVVDLVAAFDIETSNIGHDNAAMYVWMLQLDEDRPTIVGRTWDEFACVLDRLRNVLAGQRKQLVIYCHNLSYEFQFLRAVYDFKPSEVFAVERRKVLKCSMFDNSIEFRCSYLHANMSLEAYTKKFGAKHSKLSGEEYDYKKRRYPWTPLTDAELSYCVNDVLGLVETLRIEMDHDGDTLETIPMTSTGYVRREAKRAMRNEPPGWIKSLQPDYRLYTLLSEAFRGGNTHANRYIAGRILDDVESLDESSAYPAAMVTGKFPVSPFRHLGPCDAERLKRLVYEQEKAVVMSVGFSNIRLAYIGWGCPYISISKCRNARNIDPDNGRVLSAEYLETTITDIDLRIILDEYEFDDLVIEDCYYANYGSLPVSLVRLVNDYFERKTRLKGVDGQELYYMKSKNKLNSIYGMSAQDPLKQDVIFNGVDFETDDADPGDVLAEATRKSFFPYQWGVWTTANARAMLEEGLRVVGDAFVYADTDSIKFKAGSVARKEAIYDAFWELNNKRKDAADKVGACAKDAKELDHFIGVFEFDGRYSRFVTLGAKKYAYEERGKLSVTVAGVSKKHGAAELESLGGLEAFKPGTTFVKAGGTESVYNDMSDFAIARDGHTLHIGPNVLIKDSTYTLGLAAEYERLLTRVYDVILSNNAATAAPGQEKEQEA